MCFLSYLIFLPSISQYFAIYEHRINICQQQLMLALFFSSKGEKMVTIIAQIKGENCDFTLPLDAYVFFFFSI